MNSALNENESELSVLILSVFLQVLSNIHGLFDKVIKIFRNLWGEPVLLQDSEDLIASDTFDLRNSIVISEDDTNLGGRAALLS